MRILFISDNFPPEVNAPASRTYEHCREWVEKGHKVTVLTCTPNFPQGRVYPGFKNKLFQVDEISGIKVIRVWSYVAENKGFLKRALDYLSFAFMAIIVGTFLKADRIVTTSPQFFVNFTGLYLKLLKRCPWIMEVRDIWPESILAVGSMKRNFIIKTLEKFEVLFYRTCNRLVVVTDSFRDYLLKKNIDDSKIFVVKNGINTGLFQPRQKIQNKKDFIVGYMGTLGLAHGLDFILECAKDVQLLDKDIKFYFVGDGAVRKKLRARAKELNLANVHFFDSIPKKEVPSMIETFDVGLVNLKKSETFRSVIPSKIFELGAMKKPILIGVDGEARKMVEDYELGHFFEPENKQKFIEKLFLMKNNRGSIESKAYLQFLKAYDRKVLADKMLRYVTNL